MTRLGYFLVWVLPLTLASMEPTDDRLLTDQDLLDEIELLSEVIIAARRATSLLSLTEIDRILGVSTTSSGSTPWATG